MSYKGIQLLQNMQQLSNEIQRHRWQFGFDGHRWQLLQLVLNDPKPPHYNN